MLYVKLFKDKVNLLQVIAYKEKYIIKLILFKYAWKIKKTRQLWYLDIGRLFNSSYSIDS